MHISINNSKVNRRVARCQQKFISPITSLYIQQDPEEYVSLLREAERKVLECFLWYSKKFAQIYVSQSKIAKWCDLTREYVNRILTKLEQDGIVAMLYRHKKTSCYMVSTFFDVNIRKKISYIFRAFKPFVLSLLFSKPASDPYIDFYKDYSEISSQYIKGKENYIYIPSVLREFTYARASKTGRVFIKKEVGNVMLLPSDKKKILEQLSQGIVPDNFPSEAVRNISIMPLSKFGQVKLSAFPDFAIKQAESETKKMNYLKSPFNYLFSRCVKITREKNISPDFEWIDHLKRVLKIDDSMSPVIISQAARPKTTIQQKLSSQWKDDRSDIDIEKEFTEAIDILKQKSEINPFAAIMIRSLEKLNPS